LKTLPAATGGQRFQHRRIWPIGRRRSGAGARRL
jgi:hypothetical protein